jgi:hypothetical protein
LIEKEDDLLSLLDALKHRKEGVDIDIRMMDLFLAQGFKNVYNDDDEKLSQEKYVNYLQVFDILPLGEDLGHFIRELLGPSFYEKIVLAVRDNPHIKTRFVQFLEKISMKKRNELICVFPQVFQPFLTWEKFYDLVFFVLAMDDEDHDKTHARRTLQLMLDHLSTYGFNTLYTHDTFELASSDAHKSFFVAALVIGLCRMPGYDDQATTQIFQRLFRLGYRIHEGPSSSDDLQSWPRKLLATDESTIIRN